MPPEERPIAARKPAACSAVTNGSALLPNVDGRSRTARRVRDLLAGLLAELGREPSTADLCLARRAASLAAEAERQEAHQANGEVVDVIAMTTVANSLRRLLVDLGLSPRRRSRGANVSGKAIQATIRERLARA
jgi:hypothetical protein